MNQWGRAGMVVIALLMAACSTKAQPTKPDNAVQAVPTPAPTETHTSDGSAVELPQTVQSLTIRDGTDETTVTDPTRIATALTLLKGSHRVTSSSPETVYPFVLLFDTGEKKVEVEVSPGQIRVDHSAIFVAPSLPNLLQFAAAQLYAPGRLADQYEKANTITIAATDRHITQSVTSDQRKVIVALVRSAGLADEGLMVPGVQYPSLSIELDSGKVYTFATQSILAAPNAKYTVPPSFFETLLSWLPPDRSQLGELTYLFQCRYLHVAFEGNNQSNHLHDYTFDAKNEPQTAHRIQSIMRFLASGTRAPAGFATGPIQIRLSARWKDATEEIEAGADWFRYHGTLYTLPDTADGVSSVLTAG